MRSYPAGLIPTIIYESQEARFAFSIPLEWKVHIVLKEPAWKVQPYPPYNWKQQVSTQTWVLCWGTKQTCQWSPGKAFLQVLGEAYLGPLKFNACHTHCPGGVGSTKTKLHCENLTLCTPKMGKSSRVTKMRSCTWEAVCGEKYVNRNTDLSLPLNQLCDCGKTANTVISMFSSIRWTQ